MVEKVALPESASMLAGEIGPTLLARLSTLTKAVPPRRIACLGSAPAALREQCPDAVWADVTEGADVDLIWGAPAAGANFAPYTPAMLRDIKNALTNEGMFFFATLGPQTLSPLQSLCSSATTSHAFASWPMLVDLGNALVAAGLMRPVLDREVLTFTYASATDALAELARDGWFDAASCVQDATRLLTAADGSVAVPFEVFYGVAWNATFSAWQALRFRR